MATPSARREVIQLVERFDRHSDVRVRTAIERRIAATDRQIDELVYELYGLTKEEIGIVERAGP
jgi:hypothetical protein